LQFISTVIATSS